jgi:two-component system, response regulator PdtaR
MQATAARTGAETTAPPPLTALIVEDDRLILATLSRGLALAGFNTVELSNGSTALEYCAHTPPDVALIDYDLPGLSGVEVARKLSATCSFPIIFLSAYTDDSIVAEAASAGAMAYLAKPMDPPQLVPVIRTAITRFSELRALRDQSLQLSEALQSTRNASMVVGLMMERLQLPEEEAYDRLRQFARSQSRKVSDVAAEFLSTAAKLNATVTSLKSMVPPKPKNR